MGDRLMPRQRQWSSFRLSFLGGSGQRDGRGTFLWHIWKRYKLSTNPAGTTAPRYLPSVGAGHFAFFLYKVHAVSGLYPAQQCSPLAFGRSWGSLQPPRKRAAKGQRHQPAALPHVAAGLWLPVTSLLLSHGLFSTPPMSEGAKDAAAWFFLLHLGLVEREGHLHLWVSKKTTLLE